MKLWMTNTQMESWMVSTRLKSGRGQSDLSNRLIRPCVHEAVASRTGSWLDSLHSTHLDYGLSAACGPKDSDMEGRSRQDGRVPVRLVQFIAGPYP